MPPNRAANVRRKWRYVDNCLKRAMKHLSDIHFTVAPQHPDIGGAIYAELEYLDSQRRSVLDLYRAHWGGTERGLWKTGDFDIILEEGKLMHDPQGRD